MSGVQNTSVHADFQSLTDVDYREELWHAELHTDVDYVEELQEHMFWLGDGVIWIRMASGYRMETAKNCPRQCVRWARDEEHLLKMSALRYHNPAPTAKEIFPLIPWN